MSVESYMYIFFASCATLQNKVNVAAFSFVPVPLTSALLNLPKGKSPPKIVARKVGRLWSDVREEVWFGSFFQRLIVF